MNIPLALDLRAHVAVFPMTKLQCAGVCVFALVASLVYFVSHDKKTRKIHAVWNHPDIIWHIVTKDGIAELFKEQLKEQWERIQEAQY